MTALIHGLAALALAASGAPAVAPADAPDALAQELHRGWTPNCADSPRDLQIRVAFTLGEGGRLVGRVKAGGAETSRDPLVRSDAQRAIQAVYNAAPFPSVPPEFYGQKIIVKFNTAEACS